MTITDGTYIVGSDHGRLTLHTSRTGLGRRAGHDLTIEAARWQGEVSVDSTEPSASSVSATVDVNSLTVIEGTGGLKPLTDENRAEIVRTLRGNRLLHTEKYPDISFVSTHVSGSPDAFIVQGDLTIVGQTHPVTVNCTMNGDQRVQGTTIVAQSHWGIKPYSAFLGTLKLADEVRIEFETELISTS